MQKLVLLRSDSKNYSKEEITILHNVFADGGEVGFIRTDPADFEEHSRQCKELSPVGVTLPRERPIPSKAMEEGVPHYTFGPNGKLYRVKKIQVEMEEVPIPS